MKKVIVLPGAEAQLPLVIRLKREGYHVTVFHPVVPGPCSDVADDFRMVDILDKEKCLEYAKDIQPDAILSDMCDIAMPTVSYLCKSLGLSGISEQDASLYTNKSLMRRFCEKHGLPSPAYKVCKAVEDAVAFFNEHGCKCILKPLDSNSSRGVHTVETADDIFMFFEDALKYSKCDSGIIIEEYVDGVEFTVDGIMTTDGHKSLAISEKKHYEHNKNIAYELFFTHRNKNFDYDLLRETNDAFVNKSGLRAGTFTHAEYKFSNGNFYLIEIGARGGGNFISSAIVPAMSGVDNYRCLIEGALNSDVIINIKNENNSDRSVVLYFFDVDREGYVSEIENEEVLSQNPNVIQYHFNFKIGDYVRHAANDSARIGYYIAQAENPEELRRIMQNINSRLRFVISEKTS